MSLFRKKFSFKNFKKLENIILLIGTILIVFRLFFPVLQCREINVDKSVCPKGIVAFYSFTPDPQYIFHKERTYTQALAIGAITLSLYFITKKRNFLG